MKRILVAITILAGAVAGARAGIIASDTFDYLGAGVVGGIVTNSSGVWIPNTGTANSMLLSNNTLVVSGARTEDIFKVLSGMPYLTNGPVTALYSSFKLRCIQQPGPSGAYFAHFSGTNAFQNGPPNVAGFRARVWISMTNYYNGAQANGLNGEFFLGIANNGTYTNAATGIFGVTLGNTNTVWPSALNTNTTYTVVTRYVLATGVATLWIEPSTEGDPSVTDPSPVPVETGSPYPTNGVLNIDGYSFRQSNSPNTEGTILVDNFKVGTHFADVAGNNQSPTISSIPDQRIPRDGSTGPLAFSVSDPESPANDLTISVASDNTTLVPVNYGVNVVTNADNSGNWTINITPAAGQQGSANITVNVSDSVNVSFTTFKVTVGAPTIGAIPNQITTINTATPAISFAVSDAEGDAVTLTAASSNPTLVPLANVVLGVAAPGISNVVVTPASGQSGVSTITITASDTHNTVTTTFRVTVTPAPVGVVYNENFAYTDFSGGLNDSLYGAAGGSGGPWFHVSGPLYEIQVTNFPPNGGLAYLVHTNNEDLGADFTGSASYDGSLGYVFYTAFTVNFSFTPSNLGDYFFHLGTNGTDTINFRDKVFANTAGAAAGKFRLGIANSGSSVVAQNPRDLSVGVIYEVITRYNAATGDSTLWVNPVNTGSPSVTASDNQGSATIGGVALRQPGSAIGDVAIGAMKVGTAFSDVFTPPATPPVLHFSVSGGNLILTWDSPLCALQSTSDLTGQFANVPGAVSGYSVPISGPPQFFRLVY